jgi:endonuclease/exonuclease/phosphatase family metal-dependent hydrolase
MTPRSLLLAALLALPVGARARAACAGDVCLTMVSWNLHGLPWPITTDPGGRMARVGERVRAAAPRIAAFQEVWTRGYARRLARALGPDWTPLDVKRAAGGPRGGLIVFVRESEGWAVRAAPEFRPYEAHAPWWRLLEGDGASGKGYLTVHLAYDGRPFDLIDTHLQSQYPGDDHRAVRAAQVAQLRGGVSRMDPAVPLIIAGDFNTDWREDLYSSAAVLGADLTEEFHRRCGCGTVFDSQDGRRPWIDYILSANPGRWRASAKTGLIANRGADDPYSDHDGLSCAMTLKSLK